MSKVCNEACYSYHTQYDFQKFKNARDHISLKCGALIGEITMLIGVSIAWIVHLARDKLTLPYSE